MRAAAQANSRPLQFDCLVDWAALGLYHVALPDKAPFKSGPQTRRRRPLTLGYDPGSAVTLGDDQSSPAGGSAAATTSRNWVRILACWRRRPSSFIPSFASTLREAAFPTSEWAWMRFSPGA